MRKRCSFILLLCILAAGFASAGQYRIAPPRDLRKRQPPPNYRESRLVIINDDARGYGIDVDYRRNRLELRQRATGEIYIPAYSRITLVFDDDDNWRIAGDNETLTIEIRAGQTATLRLEPKWNKRQIGLFGTVESNRKKSSRQLFKYAVRPGQPNDNRPPPPVQRPNPPPPSRPTAPPPPAQPKPQPPPPPQSRPQPGAAHQQPPSRPQPPPPGKPSSGEILGGIIDDLFGYDRPRR